MASASPESDAKSRYVVGIDLGTTNSAVAFVDATVADWRVETFAVPQLVAPGVVEARETLPSFHYERAEAEFAPGALGLPWLNEDADYAVGILAREQGAVVPGRLISSAKSWLCHSGVDRLAELLPWHGAPDVDRLSPVAVSGRYLAHIRAAWNHRFPREPLEEQEIVLTLPASFDEVARELTVKAAAASGLPRVVLIEEPQAAIYQWINAHRENWERLVHPGQRILICDIGGGTSDFTLIHVGLDRQVKTQFHRVAVGEHLILGGDNLDLALAHHVERKLAGDGKLEPRQWSVLVQRARQVKETLLGDQPPEKFTISLPGTGAQLIGGAIQVELTRDEVQQLLVDGFFPFVQVDERPIARRSGFQEFGLPYAADAAITRYLAAFLTAHRFTVAPSEVRGAIDQSRNEPGVKGRHWPTSLASGTPATALASGTQLTTQPSPLTSPDPARPDVVLFNGGVFDAPLLRERMIDVIRSWFTAGGSDWRPQILENDRRDLAVARGAAYYGMVRRGLGVRIAAGLARSYFIGATTAEGAASAVCILPAGIEEGQSVELTDREFHLLIRQPVEFPLYVSSTQLVARAGDVVEIDAEQMTALAPIRTVLQSGKKTAAADSVAVHLHARLTEIGTLELWFSEAAGPRTWKLQFDVRAATRTDVAAHETLGEQAGIVDQALLDACRASIEQTFSRSVEGERLKPESLMKRLTETLDLPRSDWPPSLLRELWQVLIDCEPGRKQSPQHEARWLSLLGFALRPGYGMAIDDWRVAQTRRLVGSLAFNNPTSRAEWWILWRRIAGGLPAGQQQALAGPPIAEIRNAHRALGKGRGLEARAGTHEAAELWRILGSLELLGVPDKIELGNMLLDMVPREKATAVQSAAVWALGRIGARVPLYGPLNTVVPADVAGSWSERLVKLPIEPETTPLALMQIARKTGDRYRDVIDKIRSRVLAWFGLRSVPSHFVQLVAEGGQLEESEQSLIFGESLPQGLRMV
jgi:hypothetical protein